MSIGEESMGILIKISELSERTLLCLPVTVHSLVDISDTSNTCNVDMDAKTVIITEKSVAS